MKTYALANGEVKAIKSLTFEQMFSAATQSGQLTGNSGGLAAAYKAGVWAYRCIQLRANAIGGIPLRVIDASGEPVEGHPAQALFGDGSSDLLARIEAALCIWGVAYVEPVWNGLNRLHSLKWLNPLTVSPVIGPTGITGFYHNPQTGGRSVTFAPDELVYLKAFNPGDDLGGLAPLAVALGAVNADRNTVQFLQAFFGNGARPDGILTVPDALGNGDIDRLEAKWKRVFRGVQNAFRTLIVGGQGITYTPVASAPQDLALAEVRAENRRDICSAFGVPPVLAGAWEAANYATAAQQRAGFYTETILPECDFIADELNRQIMAVYFPGFTVKFDAESVDALQGNELTRNQAIAAAFTGGWLTRNEARQRAGLPPVEGGDQFADPGVSAPGLPFQGEREYP